MQVASQLNLKTSGFRKGFGDALLQLHESENINESRFVSVVLTEADIGVQVPGVVALEHAAPETLQAGGIVAVVVFPDLPGDGLGPARVGRLGELLAHDLDLIEGLGDAGHRVAEEPLMVSVFPARIPFA